VRSNLYRLCSITIILIILYYNEEYLKKQILSGRCGRSDGQKAVCITMGRSQRKSSSLIKEFVSSKRQECSRKFLSKCFEGKFLILLKCKKPVYSRPSQYSRWNKTNLKQAILKSVFIKVGPHASGSKLHWHLKHTIISDLKSFTTRWADGTQ